MPEDDNEKKEKKQDDEDAPPVAEPAPHKNSAPHAAPPPYGVPPGQYGPPPSRPFEPGGLASNRILFVMILLGIILLLLGSIISAYAPTIYDYKEDDQNDRDDNNERMQNTKAAGNIIFNLGIFFLAFFIILAGAFREDMNQYVRLGMVIAAAVIITKFIAL